MGGARAFWMQMDLQTPQGCVEISCEDGPRPDRSGKSFMNVGNRRSASPTLPLMSVHLSKNCHGQSGLWECGHLLSSSRGCWRHPLPVTSLLLMGAQGLRGESFE